MRKHCSNVCKFRPCLATESINSAPMRTIVTAAPQRQYLQTELIFWITLVPLARLFQNQGRRGVELLTLYSNVPKPHAKIKLCNAGERSNIRVRRIHTRKPPTIVIYNSHLFLTFKSFNVSNPKSYAPLPTPFGMSPTSNCIPTLVYHSSQRRSTDLPFSTTAGWLDIATPWLLPCLRPPTLPGG